MLLNYIKKLGKLNILCEIIHIYNNIKLLFNLYVNYEICLMDPYLFKCFAVVIDNRTYLPKYHL